MRAERVVRVRLYSSPSWAQMSPTHPRISIDTSRKVVSRAEGYRKSASHLAVHMRTPGPVKLGQLP